MKNVKCDIKKTLPLFLGGIGLLAVCFFFVVCDFRRYVDESAFKNDVLYYIIKVFMAFSFLFFGSCMLFIARSMLFYKNKMIEFEDAYMIDNSSYIGGGKMQYTEIADVYIKGSFLCIKLHNEEEFFENQNWFKKLLIKGNKKMGYEYITISDNFLDANLLEIKMMIAEKINR